MLLRVLKNIVSSGDRTEVGGKIAYQPLPQSRHARQIVGLAAGSTGDSLTNQMRELGALFEGKGYALKIINVNEPDWYEALIAILESQDVKLVFSFAGMAGDIVDSVHQQSIWQLFQVPFFRFQLDTPAYFPDRHILPRQGQINYYWFDEHNNFFKRYGNGGLSATMRPWIIESKPLDPGVLQRKIDGPIIFLKNGNDPETLRNFWRDAFPSLLSKTLLGASESLSDRLDLTTTLDIAPEVIFQAASLDFDIANSKSYLFLCVAQLDDYLRRVKSRLIAESMIEYPVQLWGFNWDGFSVPSSGKLQMKGGIDYSKTTALMDSALALVDMSPNTVSSPHDRILKCIGRQTKFVSNTQDFISQWGIDDLGVDFSFNKESIGMRIESMLASPKRTIEEGVEASRVVRQQVSQEGVVDQMLTLADLLRFGLSERPAGMQNFVDWPHAV